MQTMPYRSKKSKAQKKNHAKMEVRNGKIVGKLKDAEIVDIDDDWQKESHNHAR